MRKVTIQVESIGAGFKRFKTAWKTGKPQGEFITFDTLGTMLKTLTPKRWELVEMLQARGPLGVRALARELGRDVKNVHADVQALMEIGLVEQRGRQVAVPFDEIRTAFMVRKAA
ncbi:MAG TPA: transcriptional regulator [Burkholderiales bacterium]|jgi:predicted transcriptional regulator|nr:transcriptional regulator [Burkholderiales bacterium]